MYEDEQCRVYQVNLSYSDPEDCSDFYNEHQVIMTF